MVPHISRTCIFLNSVLHISFMWCRWNGWRQFISSDYIIIFKICTRIKLLVLQRTISISVDCRTKELCFTCNRVHGCASSEWKDWFKFKIMLCICYRNDENGKCRIKKEFVYTGFSCDVVQGHWVKSVWGNEGG